jgi:hypothetical protein
LLRCIGRSRSAKTLSSPGLKKNARQKDQEMTNYPVEFHRRLERKDEDEDEKDKDWRDEPAVVREPDDED